MRLSGAIGRALTSGDSKLDAQGIAEPSPTQRAKGPRPSHTRLLDASALRACGGNPTSMIAGLVGLIVRGLTGRPLSLPARGTQLAAGRMLNSIGDWPTLLLFRSSIVSSKV